MDGIRGLFLLEYNKYDYDLIYQRCFFNIESCAKHIQGHEYTNVYSLKNLERLLTEQIINKRYDETDKKRFIELNEIISSYSIYVKIKKRNIKKIKKIEPFLMTKKGNLVLIGLLYLNNNNNNISYTKNKNKEDLIETSINKLVYYNLMQNIITYIEQIYRFEYANENAKKNKNENKNKNKKNEIDTQNESYIYYSQLILQKLKKQMDLYINLTIPYGRFFNQPPNFMNYLKKDLYKCDDILQSNFSLFFNFLFFINKENSNNVNTTTNTNANITITATTTNNNNNNNIRTRISSKEDIIKKTLIDNEPKEEIAKKHILEKQNEKQKTENDILYVNTKPPFVFSTNTKSISVIRLKNNLKKLLIRFFNIINGKQQNYIQINSTTYCEWKHTSLVPLLLFFYNYISFFQKKKIIPIVHNLDKGENVKFNIKDNILSYIPYYTHERDSGESVVIRISEELSCYITDCENSEAEITGEVIIENKAEQYLDVDLNLQMTNTNYDYYITDMSNVHKRDKNLRIQFLLKYPQYRILKYYYKNIGCPFIGYYKVVIVDDFKLEVNIMFQWNEKNGPYKKLSKKFDEYLYIIFPFPCVILNNSLKSDLGEITLETKNVVKWNLTTYTSDSPAKMYGQIEFNEKVPLKQFVGEVFMFSKLKYSDTKILYLNKNYSSFYTFKTKTATLLSF